MSTTATINNYIPGFRKTAGLVKREILDNKTSFVTLPLVIAGLIALTTIGNMFFSMDHIYAMVGVHEIGDMSIGGMGLNDYIDDMEPGAAKKLIGGAALALAVPLLMILPIVMINALLSTLFDDRKDRSYLFFKSMPISDTHEVVTKLGTILVGAPLISFAIAFALQIVVAIGISLFFLPTDMPVGALWLNMPILSAWTPVFLLMTTWLLWALPFIGWGVAVSAYAPKAPLMFAIVPLVAVSLVEQMVMKSGHFAQWLSGYGGGHFIKNVAEMKIDRIGMTVSDFGDVNASMVNTSEAFTILGNSLSQANFWVGAAIGVGLIALAIRGRKYNV